MRLAETAGTAFVDNLLQALPQRGEIEVKGVSCVDETFDAMYRSETRAGAAIFVFALTTIFISCLGLYGFMLAIIRQRKREFAIRCALGATVRHVLSLMGSEIAVFVAISAVIGCSVAWYAGRVWLQEFPYRIDLSAEVPISTVAIVALLIGLTVFSSCYQTLAERPADALRQA